MTFENFIWGGPVHNALLKAKLDLEPKSIITRKIYFFISFTWLPLLIFSISQSSAYNPAITVSLVNDIVVWVRFFVALPILFYAERAIKVRVSGTLNHFIESGIINQSNYDSYEAIVKKLIKIRNSVIPEIIILAASYAVVLLFWKKTDAANMVSTWLFNADKTLTLSGYWYYFVSAPIFQFFLYRLIFKFFLWAVFLYKVSKIELNLVPINPDQCGGLNFLGITTVVWGFIGIAQGSVVSAQMSTFILYYNKHLNDYKFAICITILILLILYFFPMLFFMGKLLQVRYRGFMEYGVLSNKYVEGFNTKWIKGYNPENESLLGTGDIQSLADLFNSYQIIEKMKIVPFNLKQTLFLILMTAIPYFPLLFFIITPLQILEYIVQIFL